MLRQKLRQKEMFNQSLIGCLSWCILERWLCHIGRRCHWCWCLPTSRSLVWVRRSFLQELKVAAAEPNQSIDGRCVFAPFHSCFSLWFAHSTNHQNSGIRSKWWLCAGLGWICRLRMGFGWGWGWFGGRLRAGLRVGFRADSDFRKTQAARQKSVKAANGKLTRTI